MIGWYVYEIMKQQGDATFDEIAYHTLSRIHSEFRCNESDVRNVLEKLTKENRIYLDQRNNKYYLLPEESKVSTRQHI